jgi:hypothetical protein
MSPCLVQQLFRQKIGQELDQDLVDGVFFPMLRSRKDYPRELLLDIKLTQSWSCNENGHSAIVIPRVIDHAVDVPQEDIPKNISPFEVPMGPFSLWLPSRKQRCPGKISGEMRRLRHESLWGSINILNKLRSLKHPHIQYHPDPDDQDCDLCADYFDGVYIRLEEVGLLDRSASDIDFVNDFLEDALNTGKRLSWGGNPTIPNYFDNILSTRY